MYARVNELVPAAAAAGAAEPAFAEAARVKRADLFWLVATARHAAGRAAGLSALLERVVDQPWRFTLGTVAYADFAAAVAATEATLVAPGDDVIIDGCRACAMAPRDKWIVAIALLWGSRWAWGRGAPACAPSGFAAAAAAVAAGCRRPAE